jgi:hypothetical protein
MNSTHIVHSTRTYKRPGYVESRTILGGAALVFRCHPCGHSCAMHSMTRWVGWPLPREPYDDGARRIAAEARRRLGIDPWRVLAAVAEACRRRDAVVT